MPFCNSDVHEELVNLEPDWLSERWCYLVNGTGFSYPVSSFPPLPHPHHSNPLSFSTHPHPPLPHFCVLLTPFPHTHHPTPLTSFTYPQTFSPTLALPSPNPPPPTLIIPFSYPPLPTLTPVPPFPTPLPLSTPLPYSLLAHSSTLLPLIRILFSSIPPYSSPHSYLFQRLEHTWQCLFSYMHSKVQESSVQF